MAPSSRANFLAEILRRISAMASFKALSSRNSHAASFQTNPHVWPCLKSNTFLTFDKWPKRFLETAETTQNLVRHTTCVISSPLKKRSLPAPGQTALSPTFMGAIWRHHFDLGGLHSLKEVALESARQVLGSEPIVASSGMPHIQCVSSILHHLRIVW